MTDRTCGVGGCDTPVHANGWCGPHNHRWKRYGDPLGEPEAKPLPKSCAVGTCGEPSIARGWCHAHWRRWKETGDVRADVPIGHQNRYAPGSVCAVEDCPEAPRKRGWCDMHYRRWQRRGDPLSVAFIKGDLWARVESYIDTSGSPDACHQWTGPVQGSGYGQTIVDGELKTIHVLLWEQENGPKPPGIELDHECHNQAIRNGLCLPGICPHRLCCNLRHLVPRTRAEHVAASPGRSSEVRRNGRRKRAA